LRGYTITQKVFADIVYQACFTNWYYKAEKIK